LLGLPDTRWGTRLSSLSVLLTKWKINHEILVNNGKINRGIRTKPTSFAKCMESFDFVIVAVMKQQIIRFVKPQTLQFKNLAVISFWHRLGLIA